MRKAVVLVFIWLLIVNSAMAFRPLWPFVRRTGDTVTGPLKVTDYVSAEGVRSSTFESTVADGTAPFTVVSTTAVTNLNADLLDGHEWSDVPIGSDYVLKTGDIVTGALTVEGFVETDYLLISPEAVCPVPSGTIEGTVWYDSTLHKLYCWNGTEWVSLMEVGGNGAALPYGYAQLVTNGTNTINQINFGVGATVTSDATGMTWDDTNKEFDIEETGKYEIAMYGNLEAAGVGLVDLRVKVDGVEKNKITPYVHSSTDPETRGISWVGTISNESSVTATIHGLSFTQQLKLGSTLIVQRIY